MDDKMMGTPRIFFRSLHCILTVFNYQVEALEKEENTKNIKRISNATETLLVSFWEDWLSSK